MTEENIELQERYRKSIISEIKRLNANYTGIDELTIDALEAIREMEVKKADTSADTPEPKFKDLKGNKKEPDTKKVENDAPAVMKFNRLQVFHPQYTPTENMAK